MSDQKKQMMCRCQCGCADACSAACTNNTGTHQLDLLYMQLPIGLFCSSSDLYSFSNNWQLYNSSMHKRPRSKPLSCMQMPMWLCWCTCSSMQEGHCELCARTTMSPLLSCLSQPFFKLLPPARPCLMMTAHLLRSCRSWLTRTLPSSTGLISPCKYE